MMQMKQWIQSKIGYIVLGTALLLVSVYVLILSTPVTLPASDPVLVVPKGATLTSIASQLQSRGVIHNPKSFCLAVQMLGKSRALKAGKFNLRGIRNYRDLIQTLLNSQVHFVRITIPEGYTISQIATVLSHQMNCTLNDFLNQAYNPDLLLQYDIKARSFEGYLFPDTYELNECDSAETIIRRMLRRFFEVVTEEMRDEIRQSGRTLHEVITLASIVEGECMVEAERPIVASVYVNRLRRRMRLESDPTIQYIIPDGPRRLLHKDLEIDSPYNTYLYRGLPPGPINNPGRKSIEAALRPADTDFLYMVARGDGSHVFTNNYQEFLRAKRRFQRVRRAVARKNE